MPIITTKTVAYYLIRLTVDMDSMSGEVVLRKVTDGTPDGDIKFTIEGEEFTTLIGSMPGEGLTRADDATLTVYQYAVDKGYLSGEIS